MHVFVILNYCFPILYTASLSMTVFIFCILSPYVCFSYSKLLCSYSVYCLLMYDCLHILYIISLCTSMFFLFCTNVFIFCTVFPYVLLFSFRFTVFFSVLSTLYVILPPGISPIAVSIKYIYNCYTIIPVAGRRGPYVCETSRLTHLIENRLTDGGVVVSLTHSPPLTPRKIPGSHWIRTFIQFRRYLNWRSFRMVYKLWSGT
jgi:hypothetical protein